MYINVSYRGLNFQTTVSTSQVHMYSLNPGMNFEFKLGFEILKL